MSLIEDLLPVPAPQSDLSTAPVDRSFDPSINLDPIPTTYKPTEQQWWDNFAQAPTSTTTQLEPVKFDWDENADRYTGSEHIRQLGYDPYLGSTNVDGKYYNLNEIKYQHAQTFGDVMKNGLGQFAGLAWTSFKGSAESDANFWNAFTGLLWNPDNTTFKERLIGAPDELLADDKEQKAVMNKYAIFTSPETDNTVFNKEFLGSTIGQLGFTAGTGTYIGLETILTMGAADLLLPVTKASQLVRAGRSIEKATEIAAKSEGFLTYADVARKSNAASRGVLDIKKLTDVGRDRNVMTSMWQGMKNLVPGYQAANDIRLAKIAGATWKEGLTAGLPGTIKSYTMFNAARAEATMESAGTYGQMYMELTNKYHDRYSKDPEGADLERIKTMAYGASTDNYIVNTGLLMGMNEMEFGNFMSKFSSTKRLFREAAENSSEDLYTVVGKMKSGEVGARVYTTGRLNGLGNFNVIRKDFGIGTALWQTTKQLQKNALKFELGEGLQEILQSTSDATFRDYYTNLYNGNKDIEGNFLKRITAADWSKGLNTQLNMEGWKTFLMGATTGLFLSPITAMAMYARQQGSAALNKDYKDQLIANKKLSEENRDILNAFYSDAKGNFLTHLEGFKVQAANAKGMQESLPYNDKYTYNNHKDDALTKAAAVAIKTGQIESFLDTVRSLGDGRLTDQEFSEAMNIEPVDGKYVPSAGYVEKVAKDIEQFYTNWQNLKDKYGDLVIPEMYTDPLMYKIAKQQKAALDDAIEILASTNRSADTTLERAASIRNTMSVLPDIGQSVNAAFEHLSSIDNTTKEIKRLTQQLAIMKGLTDQQSNQDRGLYEQQLETLKKWQSAYKTNQEHKKLYAEGKSSELETTYGTPGPATENIHALMDSFKRYIELYNKVAGKGPINVRYDHLTEAYEGLIDMIDLNRDHGQYIDALNVLSDPRNFKRLWEKVLDGIQHGTVNVQAEAAEEVNQRANSTTAEEPGDTTAEPEPPVIDETDYRGLSDEFRAYARDSDITLSDSAQEYLDNHPRFDNKLHTIIDQYSGDPKALIRLSDQVIDDEFKDAIDKQKATDKEAGTKPAPIPREGSTPFDSSQPKSSDPWALTNVGIPKAGGPAAPVTLQDIQLSVANILSIPQEVWPSGDGLSIKVTKNTSVADNRYHIPGNTQILQRGQGYSLTLSYNDKVIGYLTNPSAQFYTAPDGTTKDISELTLADIDALYAPTRQFPTAQDWLNQLTATNADAQRLAELITGGKVDPSKLVFTPHYNYDWISTGEVGAKLDDLQGVYRTPSGQLKFTVVNNLSDKLDEVQAVNVTREERRQAHSTPVKGRLSMYTAYVWLANGKIATIQLTPRQMIGDELSEFIPVISGIDSKDKADIAAEQLKKLFISLPVYSDEHEEKKGVAIRLAPVKSDNGYAIKVYVSYTVGDKKIETSVNIPRTKAVFSNTEEFLQRLNEALDKDKIRKFIAENVSGTPLPLIGETNLKWQPSNDAIDNMETNVRVNIFKSIALTYSVPDTKGDKRMDEDKPSIVTIPDNVTIVGEGADAKAVTEVDPATLLKAKKDTQKRLKDAKNAVPKITDKSYTAEDIEDMDKFREFVNSKLPDFISIGELDDTIDRLLDNGVLVGQFRTYINELGRKAGKIETRAENPFKYHEAFHAIFRLLLSSEQQNKLLEAANKINPITTNKLAKFRTSHPRYIPMTEQQLRREYQEEFIADEFDKYSMDRSKSKATSAIREFFNKLWDWIRYIGDLFTGNRTRALFYRVHTGDYTNARLQENSFTTDTTFRTSDPVPKIRIGLQETVVKLGNGKTRTVITDKYLPSYKSAQLTADITAMVLLEVGDQSSVNLDKVVNRILDKYRDTYDPLSQVNIDRFKAIPNTTARLQWFDQLSDLHAAFDDKDARKSLTDNIFNSLRIQGIKDSLDTEYDDTVEEVGERNSDNRFKNSASIGGYQSVGKDLKMYIASNHVRLIDIGKVDELGIDTHADGTPVIQAVDSNYIYNGLLKVLSGTSDVNEVMDRILGYLSEGNNSETSKFLTKWLDETRFDIQGYIQSGKRECATEEGANLYNRVLGGFMQMSYNYASVIMDPENNKTLLVDSSRENAERYQFREGTNAFYQNYQKRLDEVRKDRWTAKRRKDILDNALEPIDSFIEQVGTDADKATTIDDDQLEILSNNISIQLGDRLGLYLHPTFIKFSIVYSKNPAVRTQRQNELLSAYPRVYPIRVQQLKSQFKSVLESYKNPFTKPEGEIGTTASESWLLKIYKSNALFDETINTMSHTNSKGETIYDFGYPSYNADIISSLNNDSVIEQLKDDIDTKGSFLLYDENFIELDKSLIVAGGLNLQDTYTTKGEVETDEFGNKIDPTELKTKLSNKEGTDFGDFNGREYSVFNLAAYDISRTEGAYQKRVDGADYYITPVSLGPIAEKSTHHFVPLPVRDAIQSKGDGWAITDTVKELYYNEVQDEVDRIRRVYLEIAQGKQARIDAGLEWIKDYHDGQLRGLKLFRTAALLDRKVVSDDDKTLLQTIEEGAIGPNFNFEDHKAEIGTVVNKSLVAQVQAYKKQLVADGLMTKDNKNILLPAYLFRGLTEEYNTALNLSKNFDRNLAQVYVNNHLNYMGITHLIYGDEAKRVSDYADLWKRRAGANAQGSSINNKAGIADTDITPVDTIDHVTYPDNKFTSIQGDEMKSDDGQMYITPKGYKSFMLGQGKLTDMRISVLDKLQRGRELSKKEQKNMLKRGAVCNPMKVVYNDTYTYLKCSAANLLLEDNAYKIGNEWYPLPGRERNFDLLMKATEQEAKGNPVVLHPLSVSKGMKANIAPSIDAIDDKYFLPLEAKYMRLQVENPSGKTEGAKPVQPAYQLLAGLDMSDPATEATIQEYMTAVNQKVTNSAMAAINEVFDSKEPILSLDNLPADLTFNQGKFMDKFISTLMATGVDAQTLEFYTTEDGIAQYNINLPPLVEKSVQLALAGFIKGVTKESVPLWQMTIISDSGFSVIRKVTKVGEDGQPLMWNIIPMSDYKKFPNRYNLKFGDDNGIFSDLSEGEYIADILRDNIPHYDDKGNILYYYTEGLRPFQTDDEIDNDRFSDTLTFGLGSRIPGTDKHSYTHVKWVDTISTAHGSSCVLSRHLMSRDGHDNDLDKFFVQIPDTYINGNDRVAYGTAANDDSKYHEYRMWMLDNNKQVRDLYYADKLYSAEEGIATLLSDSTVDEVRLTSVLQELKLPTTTQEFIDRGGNKLNNGVQNNIALAAQIRLLSSEDISGGGKNAIINQATSTEPVKDYTRQLTSELSVPLEGADEISPRAQYIIDKLNSKLGDHNGMLGQRNAYETVKEGSHDIGVVANIIQAGSVLNQFGVKVRDGFEYTFDGKEYKDYGRNRTESGKLISSQIDTLAQMDVDAPKDGLPSKFMLNAEFTGYIANMVRLGQDLEVALLYPMTPVWQAYANRVSDNLRNFKTGFTKGPDKMLAEMLEDMAKKGANRVTLNRDKIVEYLKSGERNLDMEYTLLDDLRVMRALTDPMKQLSKFGKMDTGRDLTSWESLSALQEAATKVGVGMDDTKFSKSSIPYDIRDIITDKHGKLSSDYKVLQVLDKIIGPKMFMEKSQAFETIQGMITANFNIPSNDSVFIKTMKHDIISYLSLTAYKKWLVDNGRDEILDTFNQGLIWVNGKSDKSIVSIIQNLREQLKGRDSNYLLNKFLNIVEKDINSSVNQVKANTWTRLSEQIQQRLVGSFVDLIANSKGDIHKGGLALFNYLLVKDGGQFRNGSFIRFVPAFMLKDWSDNITRVVDVLSSVNSTDTKAYIDLFGKDYNQLITDFVDAYSTHISNKEYLKEYRQGTYAGYLIPKDAPEGLANAIKAHKTVPAYASPNGDTITVDVFRGIRKWQDMGSKGIVIKKGKFDDIEKALLNRNIAYIQSAGFTTDGVKVQFPFSIRRGNRVYVLNAFSTDEAGLVKDMLSTNQLIPAATLAIYKAVVPDGDSKQWKAAKAVFGPYLNDISTEPQSPKQGIKDEQETPPESTVYTGTDATKALLDNYGIGTMILGGQLTFIKDDDIYEVPRGTTPEKLLDQLNNPTQSQQPAVPLQQMQAIPLTTNFTRQSVAQDSGYLYLFTDNAKRSSGSNRIDPNSQYTKKFGQGNYPGMTQAVIRGLENAYPITTMVDDRRTQWTDDKLAEYKEIIDTEIDYIKDALSTGKYKGIKFAAQMPFGKGQISNMRQSAPKIWQYMNEKLGEIGIDNTGDRPINIQSVHSQSAISPDDIEEQIRKCKGK